MSVSRRRVGSEVAAIVRLRDMFLVVRHARASVVLGEILERRDEKVETLARGVRTVQAVGIPEQRETPAEHTAAVRLIEGGERVFGTPLALGEVLRLILQPRFVQERTRGRRCSRQI